MLNERSAFATNSFCESPQVSYSLINRIHSSGPGRRIRPDYDGRSRQTRCPWPYGYVAGDDLTVVVVHHLTKSSAKTPRGSSDLPALADSVITVSKVSAKAKAHVVSLVADDHSGAPERATISLINAKGGRVVVEEGSGAAREIEAAIVSVIGSKFLSRNAIAKALRRRKVSIGNDKVKPFLSGMKTRGVLALRGDKWGKAS